MKYLLGFLLLFGMGCTTVTKERAPVQKPVVKQVQKAPASFFKIGSCYVSVDHTTGLYLIDVVHGDIVAVEQADLVNHRTRIASIYLKDLNKLREFFTEIDCNTGAKLHEASI